MRDEQHTLSTEALREQLIAVPGVASAEVEVGAGASPAGVKVKLTPDANARRVGAEVQRLLAARGIRSRFSEDAAPEPDASESDEAGPVNTLPPQPEHSSPVPPEEPPPLPEERAVVPTAIEETPDAPPPGPANVGPALRSVAVEERSDGLGVIVTLTDGTSATCSFTSVGSDLDAAVVTAVAEAVGVAAETVATEWLEVEGGSVVTVVLRRDGALVAGAGVVRLGRAFAVGLAASSALGA